MEIGYIKVGGRIFIEVSCAFSIRLVIVLRCGQELASLFFRILSKAFGLSIKGVWHMLVLVIVPL